MIMLRIAFFTLATALQASSAMEVTAQEPRPGALEPLEPKYGVRLEPSVMISMRDGVRLSTDLYFPEGAPGKLPVVLIRSPYNKKRYELASEVLVAPRLFTGQGYVVAVQDTRGKWESEGTYTLNRGYREDGYDTIEWLAGQPWSNGKVGTYSCSYEGENQLYMAPSRPPSLAAMIPQASATAIGSAGGFYGNAHDFTAGGVHIAGLAEWHHQNLHKVYYRPPAGLSREEFLAIRDHFDPGPEIPDADFEKLYWTLPIIDILDRAGGAPTDFREFVIHQNDMTDTWWDPFDYVTDNEPIDAPSLFIESWGDYTARAAFYIRRLYERTAVSERARSNQFIVMSPSAHCRSETMTADMRVGELDLGDPRFGHYSIYVQWFDYWLKGLDNAVTEMPKIQYYVIGRNEWGAASTWPPTRASLTKFYLHSDGRANSHWGTGTLATEAPGNELPDEYEYDPATPVMTRGGPYTAGVGSASYMDQRPASVRHDVLVYTSEPLEGGMEITGPIDLVLYASSSAKDTDFSAKLVDVFPDGRAVNVRIGFLRARYREGRDRQVFMEPGEVYRVPVSLNDISYYFKPGHRIRLMVTSSDFPAFDRNLNTGGENYDETEWVVAHNVVHHSNQHPSHLILPVISD